MNKLKKLTTFLSLLALTCAIGGFAGCKHEPEPTPPEEPDSEYIFPPDDDPIVYREIRNGTGGAFDRYECKEGYYQLEHPGNGTELFYSFSVEQTGLYALYTLDTVTESDSVTIMRYDASGQYIPTDSEGNYIGEEAELVPERSVLYSKVNCSKKYESANDLAYWRATFGITSEKAVTLRVRFVRIADPETEPETITTAINATELKGRILDEADIYNKQAILVPFGTNVFYDETYEMKVADLTTGEEKTVKGFYRIGTKERPGAVIYMAITSVPSRMFAENTFTDIQYEGNNLAVQMGKDENGNNLVNSYVNFFMNDGGIEGNTADTTKLCYENCVNVNTKEDRINENTQVGMYPVNKELYDFLKAYTAANPPSMDEADKITYADTLWLAPCYYYAEVTFGSASYPISIDTCTNKLVLTNDEAAQGEDHYASEYAEKYYNIKWVRETNADTNVSVNSGYYTITCATENAIIFYGNTNYFVPQGGTLSLTVEADTATGATFAVKYFKKGEGGEADITSGDVTISIATTKETRAGSSFTLDTRLLVDEYGNQSYIGVYEYTATTAGTLRFTTDNVGNAVVTVNGLEPTDNVYELEVTANMKIEIIVTSATQDSVSMTVSPVQA